MSDATIAENVAFGTEQPDPEQAMWAARVANAAEFIERLPLGYETRIGESGLAAVGRPTPTHRDRPGHLPPSARAGLR
jgi:ABC-type protease/lipase transport system fused ATPase/permease subunit